MSYKGSKGAIVKKNGKAIFSIKIHFLIKCHMVALDAVEVKIKVLLRLFSAVTQYNLC